MFFSLVVQESTTDSEELIYRPPSSCLSAPPDLLSTSIDADKVVAHKNEAVTPSVKISGNEMDRTSRLNVSILILNY